jgi:hypothetical protein
MAHCTAGPIRTHWSSHNQVLQLLGGPGQWAVYVFSYVYILNITTFWDLWVIAFTGSVKRCQSKSLAFSDSMCLWLAKEVGANLTKELAPKVV